MRIKPSNALLTRSILAVLVLCVSLALISAPTSSYTTRDKAFYADPKLVNFVRPGFVIKILSGEIATDGTIRVRYKITDPRGLGLDREGITTPGTISTSFVVGFIPKGQTQYTSYLTRTQTSPITNKSAIQATGENNGRFEKVADGEYIYTFTGKAPANHDRTVTHTVGAYGSRNLTEFDLGTQYSDSTLNFVPNGSPVTVTRDVIATKTCNKCHDPLGEHGGSRRSMELCNICHTPQTTDPDTGNSVDMPVMVHKIHMGADLPSVQAGKPYKIIGNAQSEHDYSTVAFPADTTLGTRNCTACHEPGTAQSDAWLKPSRVACGACHDNVNFATGENHANLPQVSDNQCSTCHVPQGELEFDVSIKGAHQIPRFSRDLPGTVFTVVKVDDGVAGKRPTVTFTVKDKSGKPILPSEMASLRLTLAGPTSDYATYAQDDVRTATGSTSGTYVWTMSNAIPATAKGSFAVYMEGYRSLTLMAGTKKEVVQRDAGANVVSYFSVDGSPVAPRRTSVALAKCNSCHSNLSLHGDNRNRIEACVICHNPNENDRTRRPAGEMPAQTVDFRHMIHRIHTGEENEQEYTIFGFGGSKNDFTEVRYPGDRRNCDACHVNASQQVPTSETLLPVQSPRGLLKTMGPATAACTGCHTGKAAASHALANTTTLGESCAACHAEGYEFGVNKVHAR